MLGRFLHLSESAFVSLQHEAHISTFLIQLLWWISHRVCAAKWKVPVTELAFNKYYLLLSFIILIRKRKPASLETSGVKQKASWRKWMILFHTALREFSPEEMSSQEEGQTKGTTRGWGWFVWKESYNWERKPNLLHEIELQIIKVSTWGADQNTDSIGKKLIIVQKNVYSGTLTVRILSLSVSPWQRICFIYW